MTGSEMELREVTCFWIGNVYVELLQYVTPAGRPFVQLSEGAPGIHARPESTEAVAT